ncbi:hypothetical protein CCR75_003632 [Bremia lactucae]|uniref:Uncharacterized protein n=1 Tax=Bremia lactucae TaxID=4779 RepID=A0A976ILK5_BRELC|nr:hypothetical protein CCR75_003632 [Bremia lactucae]
MVAGTSNQRVDVFISRMACLELKDLGMAEKFLGMHVRYNSESGHKIDQIPTMIELLSKHGLYKANLVRSRIRKYLLDDDQKGGGSSMPANGPGTPERPTIKIFHLLLGSLLWIARCSRPDIFLPLLACARTDNWRLQVGETYCALLG